MARSFLGLPANSVVADLLGPNQCYDEERLKSIPGSLPICLASDWVMSSISQCVLHADVVL